MYFELEIHCVQNVALPIVSEHCYLFGARLRGGGRNLQKCMFPKGLKVSAPDFNESPPPPKSVAPSPAGPPPPAAGSGSGLYIYVCARMSLYHSVSGNTVSQTVKMSHYIMKSLHSGFRPVSSLQQKGYP